MIAQFNSYNLDLDCAIKIYVNNYRYVLFFARLCSALNVSADYLLFGKK